jgi:hypothetical protein
MTATPTDIYEALTDAVRALGGAKVVGHMLKPSKTVPAAERWLLDCLNPHRAETLDPEEVCAIRRAARRAGHHGLVEFECDDSGYSHPLPISTEVEAEKLQREFIEAVNRQERLFAQMRAAGLKVE